MIQKASFEDFVGVVFTIIIVFWVLGLLLRLLAPYLLRYFARKLQKKMMNSFGQSPENTPKEAPTSKERFAFKEKKKVGEYIDFEELD